MSDGGTQIKLAFIDKAWAWVSSQPITNILLVLQLLLMAGGGYGTVKYIIPVHLKQIQDGYQKQDEQHTKQIESIIKSHESENARAFTVIETLMHNRDNGGVLNPDAKNVAGKEQP